MLTPAQRDELLAADLKNIAEKVAAGAPLTARERKLIVENTESEPEFEKLVPPPEPPTCTPKQRAKRLARIKTKQSDGKSLSADDEAFLTEEALRKQRENIRTKALEGGVLTARQEAALGQASIGAPSAAESGFAGTWDDLAVRLGVTRKSIGNWRARFGAECPRDRADGRKDVSAWVAFMKSHELAAGAGDDHSIDWEGGEEFKPKAFWQSELERLKVEDRKDAIGIRRRTLLEAAALERCFGQFLVGLRTSLSNLPTSTAGDLVGQESFHVICEILQAKVDSVLQGLCRADYLEDILPQIVEDLELDEQAAESLSLLTFGGQDKAALYALVVRLALMALQTLGRRAIVDVSGSIETRVLEDLPESPAEIDVIPTLEDSAPSPSSPAAAPKAKPTRKRPLCSSERAARKDAAAHAQAEIPTPPKKRTRPKRKK